MAGAVAGVKIRGAAELEAKFMALRREVLVGLKPAIIELAQPVADDATRFAHEDISNIGDRWSKFRVGATIKGAYIAPKSRRRRGSPRRNLGPLMLKAMQQSVDVNRDKVVVGIDLFIETTKKGAGF